MPMNPLLCSPSGKRLRTSSDMESVSSSPGVKDSTARSVRSTESNGSILDDGNNGANFVEIIKTKLSTRIVVAFTELWERLQHPLETRLYFFLTATTILSLALFSLGADGDMLGLSATQWYTFMGIIAGSVVFACICEETLYLLVDMCWRGPEEVRLYLHCLKGPLGFIGALGLVKYLLQTQDILRLIQDWRLYMSAAVIVWMCYTLKSFYHRRRFNRVLVDKFEARMCKMELQAQALSALASCPPDPVHVKAGTQLAATRLASGDEERLHALDRLKASPFVAKLQAAAKRRRESTGHLKTLFTEIVLASEEASSDTGSVDDDQNDSRRTFWVRLKAVSRGYLQVHTINGRLIIRRRRHVLSFSSRLYEFLSRMGRRQVTGRRVCDAIRNSDAEESAKEELIKEICDLLHTSDDPKALVSRESVNAACMSVFDKYKCGATVLSDFGEVTRQVSAVLDVLFWIVMVMVVQYIVKWPLDTIFAPLLTLVFGVSFALGPTVSQVCMAIAFVSFALPFEPGDRIAVGLGSTKIIVVVESISLLRTTVVTYYNETVKYPPMSFAVVTSYIYVRVALLAQPLAVLREDYEPQSQSEGHCRDPRVLRAHWQGLALAGEAPFAVLILV